MSGIRSKLRVPVMAIQTTYSNEKRERRSMTKGQTTPYLEMLTRCVPWSRSRSLRTQDTSRRSMKQPRPNALLDSFLPAALRIE